MAKHISGWGICISPFVVFLFVVVCAVDLPFYMTTGVNVDVILNCFFTCKNRASERDRPYQRKKKYSERQACWLSVPMSASEATIWLREFLEGATTKFYPDMIGSHSCKTTLLTWLVAVSDWCSAMQNEDC